MDHDAFWYGEGCVCLPTLTWTDPTYELVVDRFTESWTHSTQCPVVQAVYKIASTQQSLDAYLGYRFVFYDLCEFAECMTNYDTNC